MGILVVFIPCLNLFWAGGWECFFVCLPGYCLDLLWAGGWECFIVCFVTKTIINHTLLFFYNQIIVLFIFLFIMTNPTAHLPSILAQHIMDEEQVPSFTFPHYIPKSESSIFRVSLNVTAKDDEGLNQSLNHLCATLAKTQWKEKHLFPPVHTYTCMAPSDPRGLLTADPWPVGFQDDKWEIVQSTEAVKIDPFLR